ncbi:Beta-arabinofuranosyltransferase RAY1 [Hondaea fermentalgiana]|uniref:Beta-arabinofuranosyltransferase RAY1 n=1 Tax=Hondaea fermentalgiana TaxID=2315210 RepID=A0A2R5GN18_9STRA|nr:Beta-arabinofuranosyltransferase RAY1 [Hondaea fermentalgiana]|eukprot:GBG29264.1 Beta-arabinofuranosyltransferase RAY1 [Hondaea fermentalgiana]
MRHGAARRKERAEEDAAEGARAGLMRAVRQLAVVALATVLTYVAFSAMGAREGPAVTETAPAALLPTQNESGRTAPEEPPCAMAASKEKLLLANKASNIVDFARHVVREDSQLVTVTFASFSYRDSLINWLVASERVELRAILIVCLDKDLEQFLLHRGIPCFLEGRKEAPLESNVDPVEDRPSEDYGEAGDADASADDEDEEGAGEDAEEVEVAGAEVFSDDAGEQLSRSTVQSLFVTRMEYLMVLLENGFDVLFSDLDAVIMQDPRPLFEVADVVASRGSFPNTVGKHWGATMCMGFAFFKSTPGVLSMMENALRRTRFTRDDQRGMNNALLQIFGHSPEKAFGRKLDRDDTMHAITLDGAADFKLMILSAFALPRFCKILTVEDWNANVIGAHCRLPIEERGSHDKGNEASRDLAMERYEVFCDIKALHGKRASQKIVITNKRNGKKKFDFRDPDDLSVLLLANEAPVGMQEFAAWLRKAAKTCDFGAFAKIPASRDMMPKL